MPAWAAWPWLIASVVIHLFYFAALIESYRTGDLGQVYPIARGSAPLMTATATTVFVGENLSLVGWTGIVALVAGVLLLSARGGRALAQYRPPRRRLCAADRAHHLRLFGGGRHRRARLAQPESYVLWLLSAMRWCCCPMRSWRDGRDVIPAMRTLLAARLAGGACRRCPTASRLWAMTLAPIAIVASLRETSVLFGAVIAVVVLKEPLRAARIGAALLIVCGLMLIRLQ